MKKHMRKQANIRHLLGILLLVPFLYSCSAKIAATIKLPQPTLPDTSFVLVLQTSDQFTNDGIEIGTITSGDNGLSSNCTYYEVIERLRSLARHNGANLIKIIKHKTPDRWSSCDRLTAKIYRVPDFRKHEKEIEWSPGRKLVWEDFKAEPKTSSNPNTAAQTYCGFGFQTNFVTIFSKAKIFTRNTFSCNLSWVRPDQKYRSDLLEHEQGHFDLCEIYTRRLRRRLEEKRLTVYNLNNEASIILKEVTADYLNRQELYEQETKYGLDRQKQTEWTKQVAGELYRLNSFVR